ncbi:MULTISPECIES: helix-turn-helix transcriptional regulator [Nocardioides]|uniref:Response regulator transcription factor n=1 Tax=Nocardioides zhouii TaxID=1168729 RepID=A0A4Q2SMU1_9ACTN|nr:MULTISPECIES: response regulator transcription factor [Nocardioides]RYC05368.1 response regulator transcription factor [Nocardioides zhouii]
MPVPSAIELVLTRLAPALPSWRSVAGTNLAFGSIVDPESGTGRILCVVGAKTQALNNLEIVTGTGLGGRALALSRPTSVARYESARGITHHYDHAVRSENLVTAAAVPIVVDGRPRAVVYLCSTAELSLGDRWFDALDPLRRRLQHEILVEDAVHARLAQMATQVPPQSGPGAAELAAVVRELGDLSEELADPAVAARLELIRQRLGGGPSVRRGAVLPDGTQLTRREMQVLVEAARGHTNRQIAEHLGLLPNTVKSYLQDLMRKLGCANRVQAIAYARDAGWIG